MAALRPGLFRASSATSRCDAVRPSTAPRCRRAASCTLQQQRCSPSSSFWGQRIPQRPGRCVAQRAGFEQLTTVAEPLAPLGYDFLKFLLTCVLVTPLCKRFQVSPILGFLGSGVLLRQLNLISDPKDLAELAELGVLFLLFEMGLELSSSRLAALRVYAFGLGSLQIIVTTAVFVAFAVPFGASLGTIALELLAGADSNLVSISSWDEALVIGVALSLSSSAFVLQILGEKGELASKTGSATLGILLMQDLVTVPFLVLLPLLVSTDNNAAAQAFQELSAHPVSAMMADFKIIEQVLPTVLVTLMYLGFIILFGRFGLRRLFDVVADAGNNDAFVALCLLTVCGTSIATELIGFGQTLGAFLAGVLLAETSFRPQVEAELKPFKGLLLGLFFLCTGASVDVKILFQYFPAIVLLTMGLISTKFAITATAARQFGLTKAEAIKVGLTLSQGGEFAFVLLALAQELEVLPERLNSMLIIVVVLSMALTPVLAETGDKMMQDEELKKRQALSDSLSAEMYSEDGSEITAANNDDGSIVAVPVKTPPRHKGQVVLCGYNKGTQMVTSMLGSPLIGEAVPWVAFEFDPARVRMAREAGLPVMFGDGSRKDVLHSAGIHAPVAFVLAQRSHRQMKSALAKLRISYPGVPIFALTRDMRRGAEIQAAGATVVVESAQGGIALGNSLLRGLGATSAIDLLFLEQEMRRTVNERVSSAARAPSLPDTALEVFLFDSSQAMALEDADSRDRTASALELGILAPPSAPLLETSINPAIAPTTLLASWPRPLAREAAWDALAHPSTEPTMSAQELEADSSDSDSDSSTAASLASLDAANSAGLSAAIAAAGGNDDATGAAAAAPVNISAISDARTPNGNGGNNGGQMAPAPAGTVAGTAAGTAVGKGKTQTLKDAAAGVAQRAAGAVARRPRPGTPWPHVPSAWESMDESTSEDEVSGVGQWTIDEEDVREAKEERAAADCWERAKAKPKTREGQAALGAKPQKGRQE